MADIRKILKEHVADLVPADGVVHCRGDELTFDSMEAFGRHVDALLSRPPRSRGEAVADALATHLGELDPLPEESFAVTVGDDGRIRCGCGWTGSAAADTDEWREHLADAILEALGRVERTAWTRSPPSPIGSTCSRTRCATSASLPAATWPTGAAPRTARA